MKKVILFPILLLLSSIGVMGACVVPSDGYQYNTSSVVCTGIYEFNSSGSFGVVNSLNKENITVDFNNSIFINNKSTTGKCVDVNGKKNTTILNINCQNYLYGIQIQNSNNSKIINASLYVPSQNGFGVYVSNSAYNLIINNSYINGSGYGITLRLKSENGTIDNVITNNTRWVGIQTLSNFTKIINSKTYNSLWDGIQFISYNNTISRNSITNYLHNGLDTHNDSYITESGNSIIKDNVITQDDYSYAGGGVGIFIQASINNRLYNNSLLNLVNNTILSTSSRGIALEGSQNINLYNLVYNNTLINISGFCIYDTSENTTWNENSLTNCGGHIRALALVTQGYDSINPVYYNNYFNDNIINVTIATLNVTMNFNNTGNDLYLGTFNSALIKFIYYGRKDLNITNNTITIQKGSSKYSVYNVTGAKTLYTSIDTFTLEVGANQEYEIRTGCVFPSENMTATGTENNTLCGGQTYYLNDTGKNGVIIINENNFTFDCNNSIFIGNNTGYGLNNTHSNIIIKNCNFNNYDYGYLENVGENNTYLNVSSIGNYSFYGIRKNSGRNISIINSSFKNHSFGIAIYYTPIINIDDVLVNSTKTSGFLIGTGSKNIIVNNYNCYSARTSCISSDPSIYNIEIKNSNMFSNYNTSGGVFQLAENSRNISVLNNTFNSPGWFGVRFKGNTSDNGAIRNLTFQNNIISNSDIGLRLSRVYNSDISNNTFSNITIFSDSYNLGIDVKNGKNLSIVDNYFSDIYSVGIFLISTNDSRIEKNNFNYLSVSEKSNFNQFSQNPTHSTFKVSDWGEAPCAIKIGWSYKTYIISETNDVDCGDENVNYSCNVWATNNNITLNDNIFDSNTLCYLNIESSNDIFNDISNYDYRKFISMNSRISVQEYFLKSDSIIELINSSNLIDNWIIGSNDFQTPHIRYSFNNKFIKFERKTSSYSYNTTIYNLSLSNTLINSSGTYQDRTETELNQTIQEGKCVDVIYYSSSAQPKIVNVTDACGISAFSTDVTAMDITITNGSVNVSQLPSNGKIYTIIKKDGSFVTFTKETYYNFDSNGEWSAYGSDSAPMRLTSPIAWTLLTILTGIGLSLGLLLMIVFPVWRREVSEDWEVKQWVTYYMFVVIAVFLVRVAVVYVFNI